MKKQKADKKRQQAVVETTAKKTTKTYIWIILLVAVAAIAGGVYLMQGTHDTVIAEDEVDETRVTKKAGEDFLDANAKKEGVISLPSGLQYKVITMGKGEKPKATDTVKAHYRGCLIDGTEFDSSTKHGGEPLEFPLSGVIRGWTEILQLMPVGSKWEVYIPQYLAYGERGTMGIPPYSALVFTIELVDIVK